MQHSNVTHFSIFTNTGRASCYSGRGDERACKLLGSLTKEIRLYNCVGSVCYSLVTLQLIVCFQLSVSEEYLPQKSQEHIVGQGGQPLQEFHMSHYILLLGSCTRYQRTCAGEKHYKCFNKRKKTQEFKPPQMSEVIHHKLQSPGSFLKNYIIHLIHHSL